MKKTLFLFLFLGSLPSWLLAQSQDYFQQEVNYKINVSLDDKKHSLSGNIEMEYTNNAPQPLNEIWIHLWGNAYKDQNSAFAKQQLNTNKTKFYFSKETDKGFFNNIDFTVNAQKATWALDKKNPDIAVIKLAQPLATNQKITISTPFELQIPASFSRLGHIGESYQITQWYPKPAVFDNKGWHAMPYLNQGEFYSEFGNFDVSITLPINYVVGATGELQTESERKFIATQVQKTKMFFDTLSATAPLKSDFPASSNTTKTIRYVAKNVHDFAWFADKRFYVMHDVATLESGRKIDCYAMFTNFERNLWKQGAFYTKRAVEFYSKNVGEYPWAHATAVQSALSAGGGMEYPMITVIDKAGDAKTLDIVITHEVGHNWFYGILASNERDHGWMDEGMNSYYEERYTALYYPKHKEKTQRKGLKLSIAIDDEFEEIGYQYFARQALDQPCELHSADFTSLNYGLVMYKKTAKNMRLLEDFVGTTAFDNTMKKYYQLWKFKHPYPADFRTVWENETKGKNISWFFDELINSDHNVDAFVTKSRKAKNNDNTIGLKLKVEGATNVPIPVSGIKDDKVVHTAFYTLPEGKNKTVIDFPKGDYDKIVVDAGKNLPSRYRSPSLQGNGKLPSKYWVPRLKLINLIENPNRPLTYGVLPAVAYNHYDKMQLGAALYTPILPTIADGYAYVVPLYSFEQKQWNFTAGATNSIYFEKGKIRKFEVSTLLKSFSDGYHYQYEQNNRYFKLSIGAGVTFRNKPTSQRTNSINYRFVGISRDFIRGIDITKKLYADTTAAYGIHELKYTHKNDFVLNPSTWTVTAQAGQGFSKIFAHVRKKYQFNRKQEALYLRGFAGKFLQYDNPRASVAFRGSGRTSAFNSDYMYDNLLLGRGSDLPRNEYNPATGDKTSLKDQGGSLFSQQIFMQDAGFKTLGTFANTDNWMFGGGIAYTLPLGLPIQLRPYVDVALFPDSFTKKVKNAYSVGVATVIVPDIFEIYFPIPYKNSEGWRTLESDNIFYNKRTKYYQKISFLLNINKLNPFESIRNFKLNM